MVPFRKRNFLPSDLSGWKTHSYVSMPGNNAKPFTTAAFFDHILHWRDLLLVPASPKCCLWKRLPHSILRQSYIVLVIIQRLSSQNASKNEFLVNSFWRCLAARIQIAANPGQSTVHVKEHTQALSSSQASCISRICRYMASSYQSCYNTSIALMLYHSFLYGKHLFITVRMDDYIWKIYL